MRVKIYLDEHETEADVDDALEKALHRKHERAHAEEFEDKLVEELLSEFDSDMKRVVLIGGFEETMKELLGASYVD